MSKKQDKVAEKVLELIKNRDFTGFRKSFTDVNVLSSATRDFSFGRNSDSMLAMIVKHGDAKFLNRLLSTYFSDKTNEVDLLKEQLLSGLTSKGEKLNYHYFHDWLSPNITSQTDKVFGVEKPLKITSNDNKRMSDLYDIIKRHKIRNTMRLSPNDYTDMYIPDMVLSDGDSGIAMVGYGKNGKKTQIEADYPPILLSVSSKGMRGKKKYSVMIYTPSSDDSSGDKLSKRAYEKLDFPEEFICLADNINNTQKEWDDMYKDEYLTPIADNFVLNSGLICIDDCFTNTPKWLGYMSEDEMGRIYVNINASQHPNGSENTLGHELGHCPDLGNDKEMSDNPIIRYSWMLSVLNPKVSIEREEILEDILKGGYTPSDYCEEFIAGLSQYAIFNKAAYRDDHLLKNLYKMYGLYCIAKNYNYESVLDRISTIGNRVSGSEDFDKVYNAFSDYQFNSYMREEGIRTKYPCSILYSLGKNTKAKLQKAIDGSEKFGREDIKVVEKQFTLDMVSELRKVIAVMNDEDACYLKVPAKFRSLKTNKPVELVMIRACRDFEHNKKMPNEEHLNKVISVSKKLKERNGLGEASHSKFNEYTVYCDIYLSLAAKDKKRIKNNTSVKKSNERI